MRTELRALTIYLVVIVLVLGVGVRSHASLLPTPTPSPSPTPTASPSPSPTPSPSPSPTASPTPSPTPSASPTLSPTPSPTPSLTPTPTPCAGAMLVPSQYSTIQEAIDAAQDGCEIVVSPGTYYESISFGGKNITVRSTVPTSPTVVASTIIDAGGVGMVVLFSGAESAACVLSGFTLTNGDGGAGRGGAISADHEGTLATIEYNRIEGNEASFGCAITNCDGFIRNNVIWNNTATHGGALYNCNGILENNVIAENDAIEVVMGCYGTIRNCVIWGNTAGEGGGGQMGDTSTPQYCCIEGWTGGGTGNIASDPKFVDAANGDFHLQADSPCIDAGGAVTGVTEDIDGDARPFNGICCHVRGDGSDYDIGVDEYAAVIPEAATLTVPGDFSTIQAAIDAAQDGCEIVVSQGTYYENLQIGGKNIVLRCAESGSVIDYAPVIDGGGAGPVVAFSGTETSLCTLSGFVLTNGLASQGAGILGNGTAATIQNCEIRNNHATGEGEASTASMAS